MIFDMQSLFSDAQAITADAASTNVIDLGAPGTPKHAAAAITQDLGRGRAIPMRWQVVEAFNNLTTLAVVLQVDTVENFASPTEVLRETVALADLTVGKAGALLYVPRGVDQRFVRLYYDVTGTAPTTGKITAGLVAGNEGWAA